MLINRPPAEGEERFGLDCWRGRPYLMRETHWHNEIELNFVEAGEVRYLARGGLISAGEGQLVTFWGAMPHRVVDLAPDTVIAWLTLPLPAFLAWSFPEEVVRHVLSGHFLNDGGRLPDKSVTFARWASELQEGAPECERIVLLEVEAVLWRLARRLSVADPTPLTPAQAAHGARPGSMAHVERMVNVVSERYAEPLRVQDVADAVGLNPTYAMGLFREVLGLTVYEYLTQHRVAHAQRLLATTEDSVLDVAFACGFHSVSSFYEAFKRSCGTPPRAYRVAMRSGRA